MHSKLTLTFITICVVWALTASAAAHGVTPEQHLAKAKDAWVEAAGDKAPTLSETDAVIRELRQALAAPARLKFDDEKAARRLLVEVYRAKYSLLESPEWTNTKGGPAYLKKAKSELELILKRAPNDKKTLFEYLDILNLLGADSHPTLKRLVEFHPTDPWVRYLLARNQLQEGKRADGHENLLRAISLSESAEQLRVFLGGAEMEYGKVDCRLPAVVLEAREKLPEEHGIVATKKADWQALKKEILMELSAYKCNVKAK